MAVGESRASRGGVDESAEEVEAQRLVGGALGMPLNAEVEGSIGRGEGLDEPVMRKGDNAQGAGIADGLAVMTVHESPAELAGDLVMFRSVMIGGGGQDVGQELMDHSAGVEGHHLHAEADGKDGAFGAPIEGIKKGQLKPLSLGGDELGAGMRWDSPVGGVGVIASGEEEGVAQVEVMVKAIGSAGKDEWQAACARDEFGIGGVDAVTVCVDVGGDPNDRPGNGHRCISKRETGRVATARGRQKAPQIGGDDVPVSRAAARSAVKL